jgi:hypothetical protein
MHGFPKRTLGSTVIRASSGLPTEVIAIFDFKLYGGKPLTAELVVIAAPVLDGFLDGIGNLPALLLL